jgi:hypothetical protein
VYWVAGRCSNILSFSWGWERQNTVFIKNLDDKSVEDFNRNNLFAQHIVIISTVRSHP